MNTFMVKGETLENNKWYQLIDRGPNPHLLRWTSLSDIRRYENSDEKSTAQRKQGNKVVVKHSFLFMQGGNRKTSDTTHDRYSALTVGHQSRFGKDHCGPGSWLMNLSAAPVPWSQQPMCWIFLLIVAPLLQ